jgi:hypothetical protein
MSLATTYKSYILERIMLDYLYNGIIPTSDELAADLDIYIQSHPNLDEPVSKNKIWHVDPGEHSSAEQIADIADTISQDVGVITREIYRIAKESSRFYDRWVNEMKRLSSYARQLEQRVDSLLLLNSDTIGFFAYVGDVFGDMNKVDTESTTAKIDLHETTVSINPLLSELSMTGSAIDLSSITSQDVTFQVVNRKPGVSYSAIGDGNILSNIFKTNNSRWVGRVVSDSGGEIVCELKADLKQEREVSRIAVEFSGPLGSSSSTVTCLYSSNGYTWNLVPSVDATKTTMTNLAWIFPLTTMRYVKFIIRKPAPDNVDNSYIFSISYIRLFGNDYSTTTGSTFVSSALQALNAEGNPILFSLVALDVCQEVPIDTGIDYSIAVSQDNETWTDWMFISHSSSSDILYPKILNLSGADWKNNDIEEDTTLLNDSFLQHSIVTEFSNSLLGTHLLGYRFKSSNYGAVNTAIQVSVDEDPDTVSNSIIVWRNTRYKNILDYPDTLTVRGNPRGWGFDGGEYSCYFEIIDSDGKFIDFGDRECSIDGSRASGVTKIAAGIHKFTTKAENWHDISAAYIAAGSNVSSQEVLEEIDPLYPYNHKLLIEGYPYPIGTAYQGDRIYKGTDMSAEFYAIRTSLFDLENNLLGDSDFGYFSIRGVGDAEYPTLAVIVRYDTSTNDYTNELFSIRWRSGSTTSSAYSYVKLRAQLWTNNSGLTPVITSYRIKLGV